MFIITFSICFRIFVFSNTLYYTVALLSIIILILIELVSSGFLNSLTMLMLSIVYIGAMIILIGYICAICPNLIISLWFSKYTVLLFILLSLFFIISPNIPHYSINYTLSSYNLVDFIYSISGGYLFLSIVFILALSLLLVTSQYLTPKGPFRSVKL